MSLSEELKERVISGSKLHISDNTSRNLTRLYISALTAVAVLTILGQILVQKALNNQSADSLIINIAGRQRMLSQQISKLSLMIESNPGNDSLRHRLKKVTTEWGEAHKGLVNGDKKLGLPGNNSQEIQEMFSTITPFFNTIYNYSLTLADKKTPSDKRKQAIHHILQNEPEFLNVMNKIVFQYDYEASKKVDFLKKIELLLLILTLFILVLEGFFIFKPAAIKIRDTIKDLIMAETNSSALAKKLNFVNGSLKRSLRELKDINLALDKATILAKTDQYGLIMDVNEKFCEVTGYSRLELIGNRFNMLKSHYHSDTFFNKMWDTISSGKIWNAEIQNKAKDGTLVWFDATIIPVKDGDSNILQYIAIYNNITERFKNRINEQRIKTVSIIQGQEEERKRIAQELHDGIGQILTGLKFSIESIKGNAEEKEQERLKEIRVITKQVIQEVRRVSFNLMPSVLSDFGLVPALKNLTEQTNNHSHAEIVFKNYAGYQRMDKSLEISIYRIIQEALNNAIKHSDADKISLQLVGNEKGTDIFVIDNGKGFDKNKKSASSQNQQAGLGIRNMQERTKIINGTFEIESIPGEGTSIHIHIPNFEEEKILVHGK